MSERNATYPPRKRAPAATGVVVMAILLAGCAHTPVARNDIPVLRYTGSSTIAHFIRESEPAYGKATFIVDTEPESVGGERALLAGEADLAGVATRPQPETLSHGANATLLGHDAIAVIVHPNNPIAGLTRVQLGGIFTGRFRNWKELGGPDLAIRPYIVSAASATRKVFRSAILGQADYEGCETVQPDSAMPMKVEAEAGAIGQLSFSFLANCGHVKVLPVDGQHPSPSNPDYPISRPLYLLWWPGRTQTAEFISWTETPDARVILMKRFAVPHTESASPVQGGAQ